MKNINDYRDKKAAVVCHTIEEWRAIDKILHNFGYDKETPYAMTLNQRSHCGLEFYKTAQYELINASEFLREKEVDIFS